MRRRGYGVTLALTAAVLLGAGAGGAAADGSTIGSYPHWTQTDAGHVTGAFSAAAGGGVIRVATTGTGSGVALTPAGQAFLGSQTGFGTRFGTARDQPSLTLTAPAGGSSTTAIELPGLPAGWAFAVGDVDTEKVGLVAQDGSTTLKPAQFGPQDTLDVPQLNFCAGASPLPGGCAAAVTAGDAPWWCPDGSKAAGRLCAGLPAYPAVVGNGTDSDGAYDWFVPSAAATKLTITLHAADDHAGSIEFWIVAPVASTAVTGTITDPAGAAPPAGASVTVEHADGSAVRDLQGDPLVVPVGADGGFALPLEHGDYRLTVDPPVGYSAPAAVAFSTSSPTLALPSVALAKGLPGTGVDVGWWPVAAVVLVAAGLVLVLVRVLRRRRD